MPCANGQLHSIARVRPRNASTTGTVTPQEVLCKEHRPQRCRWVAVEVSAKRTTILPVVPTFPIVAIATNGQLGRWIFCIKVCAIRRNIPFIALGKSIQFAPCEQLDIGRSDYSGCSFGVDLADAIHSISLCLRVQANAFWNAVATIQ